MQQRDIDIWHMRSALNLARQGLGRTYPNPNVGCVIVSRDGHVIGRNRTADAGRPHAETGALKRCVAPAEGATMYVTLEPCSHHGETPPCAQSIVDSGVSRVVVAMTDPDPRVSGRGVKMIQEAGIKVETGVLADEAAAVMEGYLLRQKSQRPLITLKTATTLDAKIATLLGESQWITGDLARMRGHVERAQHDAVAVGIGTVLADKPNLLSRIDGVQYRGIRIVFDTNLQILDAGFTFERSGEHPVWVFCGLDESENKVAQLRQQSDYKVVCLEKNEQGHVDVHDALRFLANEGITRLLVEGGAELVGSFVKENLFDRLLWFSNPSLIGADGKTAIPALGIDKLDSRVRLQREQSYDLGEDRLDVYRNYYG